MFSEAVKAAIRALLKDRGHNAFTVATMAGKSRQWLSRKLGEEPGEERPIFAQDVDVVLETLNVSADDFATLIGFHVRALQAAAASKPPRGKRAAAAAAK